MDIRVAPQAKTPATPTRLTHVKPFDARQKNARKPPKPPFPPLSFVRNPLPLHRQNKDNK